MKKRVKVSAVVAVAVALAGSGQAAEVSTNAWTYSEEKDPITDEASAIAAIAGDGGYLVVRCDKPGPSSIYVAISSTKYLGALSSNTYREGIYRIDEQKPVTTSWFHKDSLAGLINNKLAMQMANQLTTAHKVAIRLKDFEGDTVDMLFAPPGDGEAITQAIKTCGQKTG